MTTTEYDSEQSSPIYTTDEDGRVWVRHPRPANVPDGKVWIPGTNIVIDAPATPN